MKTKPQIENFLKGKKYASEVDFKMISSYCQNEHKIKLHVPSSYDPGPNSLNCLDFSNWIEQGIGGGEIVKWGENIGLVQNGDMNNLHICLYIDSEGPNFNSITIPVQSVTLAEESAAKRIKMAISEKGLEFGNPYFILSEKFIPSPGTLTYFTRISDGAEGYGVTRLVEKDGTVRMYCYFYVGEDAKYSMNEILGNSRQFQFSSFSAADYARRTLDAQLSKAGKTWNHHLKRIEPLNMKVETGETYYYITDKMTVASDIENGKTASNKRYLCANYFRREEDAIRILADEMEIRRNYLAEPEKSPSPAK